METCVLYLRKSDENAEANDFDIQEKHCRAYAESKGYHILAVYREAHSGKLSPLTRKVLRLAVADIRADHAQVVVCRTMDRIARDIAQFYAILFEIEQQYHGRVEAADEPIDRTSKSAKMQLTIAALANDMERDRIYDRMSAGKLNRAENGQLMAAAHPAYGYQWHDDTVGKRTSYDIDPVSSRVVRQIFEKTAAGDSTMEITRWLNEQHILSPSAYAATKHQTGNREQSTSWHRESVRSILKNPGYAGKALAYRFKYTPEYRNESEVIVRSASDKSLELPSSTWPAIVTPELFDRAHQRRKQNTAGAKIRDKQSALLQGQVFCGVCGRKMVGQRMGHDYYSYACSKRRSVVTDLSQACPGGSHTMRCSAVDAIGWDAVKVQLANREQFEQLLRDKVQTQPKEELLAYVESTAGALKHKQQQQSNLAQSIGMTDNEAARQAIVGHLESVSKEVKKLEQEAAIAQKHLDEYGVNASWVEQTVDRIYSWQELWQGESYEIGTGALIDEAYDTLPWEVKRLAVVASGVRVYVWPVSWPDSPRTLVLYNVELPEEMLGKNTVSLAQLGTSIPAAPSRRRLQR